jgi:hypothetical protein
MKTTSNAQSAKIWLTIATFSLFIAPSVVSAADVQTTKKFEQNYTLDYSKATLEDLAKGIYSLTINTPIGPIKLALKPGTASQPESKAPRDRDSISEDKK